ncbi:MAG: peptidase M28 family protein, partial [Bacteroidota bacterium]
MTLRHLLLAISISPLLSFGQVADSVIIKKISDEIFVSGQCYTNLEYLCKKIGSRLSGSPGAEKSVKWTHDLMKRYGFD